MSREVLTLHSLSSGRSSETSGKTPLSPQLLHRRWSMAGNTEYGCISQSQSAAEMKMEMKMNVNLSLILTFRKWFQAHLMDCGNAAGCLSPKTLKGVCKSILSVWFSVDFYSKIKWHQCWDKTTKGPKWFLSWDICGYDFKVDIMKWSVFSKPILAWCQWWQLCQFE